MTKTKQGAAPASNAKNGKFVKDIYEKKHPSTAGKEHSRRPSKPANSKNKR